MPIKAISQNQEKADSLINSLESQPDSLRLWTLYEISRLSSSPDLAIKYAEILLDEASKIGDYFYEERALHSIGVAYRLKGELPKAQSYLLKATEIAIANQDFENLAKNYSEIATCYSLNDDIENALKFNSRAIQSLRKTNNKSALSFILLNTGYDYYSANKYDTALNYYNEAETLFLESNLQIGIAYSIGNRALVEWKLGNEQKAIEDLVKAISMLEPLGDEYGMADYYNQLGTIYHEIGDHAMAANYLSIGVKMASAVDLKEQVRDASRILSDIYYQENVTDSAYKYLYQYLSMRDTIANEETIKALANQRADFEISLKQAEVDLANQQKQNRQYLAIGLGAFLILSIVFLINVNRQSQKRRKLNNQLAELNATKDKFFSIISHDLRGPVSAFNGIGDMIDYYLKKESYDQLKMISSEINKSAKSVTELLDNLLNWAVQQQGNVPYNPAEVEIKELIDQTISIFEASASAKEISLHNEIDAMISIFVDKDTAMTIFRNLVGNALKFTEKGGSIRVSAEKQDQNLIVSVIDSGVGMSDDQVADLFSHKDTRNYGTSGERGLGLGLQLVQEFAELNKGRISVESELGVGSTFKVFLPLQKSANQAVSG